MWGESILYKLVPAWLLTERFKESYRKRCVHGSGRCVCNLCGGDGYDKTGLAVNGWTNGKHTPFCVRCGGYGTIPRCCQNPDHATDAELDQMARERESFLGPEVPSPPPEVVDA